MFLALLLFISFNLHAQEHLLAPKNFANGAYSKRYSKTFYSNSKEFLLSNDLISLVPKDYELFLLGQKDIQEDIARCFGDTRKSCALNQLKLAVDALVDAKLIDSVAGIILKNNLSGNIKRTIDYYAVSKVQVYRKLKRTRSDFFTSANKNPLNDKKFNRKFKGIGKLSPVEALYLNFKGDEILHLAELVMLTEKNMNSLDSGIFFKHDDGGEYTFNLDPSRTYEAAHFVLWAVIDQDINQYEILSRRPTELDLLAAVYVTGLVNEEELKILSETRGFETKKPNKAKIYLDMLYRLSKVALMASPLGVYSILPIIMTDSLIEGKRNREKDRILTLFNFTK